MNNTNKMQRIWVLYGLFFAVVLFCVVLFLGNIVSSEEPYRLNNLANQTGKAGLIVTDLHPTPQSRKAEEYTIDGTDNTAFITTHSFDAFISFSDKHEIYTPSIRWTVALQIFSVVAFACIFAFVVILLVSFYKAIRSGRVFNKKSLIWIRLIGTLMILLSLALDTSVCIERHTARELLASTGLQVDSEFTLHYMRLLFGIVVLFMGELIHLGNDMQEEQDLTI